MWQTILWRYLKIWEWEWIFGRAVKAISSLGVRSPWLLLRRNAFTNYVGQDKVCRLFLITVKEFFHKFKFQVGRWSKNCKAWLAEVQPQLASCNVSANPFWLKLAMYMPAVHFLAFKVQFQLRMCFSNNARNDDWNYLYLSYNSVAQKLSILAILVMFDPKNPFWLFSI